MNEQIVKDLLVENYHKYYRIIYTYLKDQHDSLDALQEGARQAIINAGSLRQTQYADTWISRIMINEALKILRQRKNETVDIQAAENIQTEDRYRNFDLENALQELNDSEREIINLKYFHELQFSEIGKILSLNVNTVKSRMYRALDKLRTSMEGDRDE